MLYRSFLHLLYIQLSPRVFSRGGLWLIRAARVCDSLRAFLDDSLYTRVTRIVRESWMDHQPTRQKVTGAPYMVSLGVLEEKIRRTHPQISNIRFSLIADGSPLAIEIQYIFEQLMLCNPRFRATYFMF